MGCVEFSRAALEHLLTLKQAEVVGVVTRRQSEFNADFASLEPIARSKGIDVFFADEADPSILADWLRSKNPDVMYCFGWSYLLKSDILSIPRLGVVGYHPAELPANRGRHPIIWALALGLPQTASTFFFMDSGADSGDLLSQKKVTILENDDAATLYKKLITVAQTQITEFTAQLSQGDYPRIPQDNSQATSWRKRSKADGQIDWRMPARSVRNLVRALTRPYPGAHCVSLGAEVKVWRAELEPKAPSNAEPGKVLKVDGREIVVMCGENAVRLVEHDFVNLPQEGAYL